MMVWGKVAVRRLKILCSLRTRCDAFPIPIDTALQYSPKGGAEAFVHE